MIFIVLIHLFFNSFLHIFAYFYFIHISDIFYFFVTIYIPMLIFILKIYLIMTEERSKGRAILSLGYRENILFSREYSEYSVHLSMSVVSLRAYAFTK